MIFLPSDTPIQSLQVYRICHVPSYRWMAPVERKTIARGVGLANAWLTEQGLLSLKSLWSELAPLRRTA